MSAEPDFKPFIADEQKLDGKPYPEFTLLPVAVGGLLGIIFAWSSAYLGLKVGLTFASSIPAAVICPER